MTTKDFPVGARVTSYSSPELKATVICNNLKFRENEVVLETDDAYVLVYKAHDLRILSNTRKVTLEVTSTWPSNFTDEHLINHYMSCLLGRDTVRIIKSEEGE